MASDRGGDVMRDLRTLFGAGVVGTLSDGELLGRFHAREDDSAELAFAALVDRHGPMVLRVCRSVLRDEHDAQDALQATFLVLARRAGSIRRRDSVGSWLYGVALRVASSARLSDARRRMHERQAAERATAAGSTGIEPDVAAILHEELARLPGRYREALVLCHLEGLACEEAAHRLGWPVGTVKSRLARGRERLRDRLTRRGLAPSVAVGGVLAAESSQAAVPLADTIRAVISSINFQSAGGGMVSPGTRALARKVVISMFLSKLRTAAAVVLACGGLAAGVVLVHQRLAVGAMPEPQSAPASKTPEKTEGQPFYFNRDTRLAANDVVEVTGLDLYRFHVRMPKGKRFRVELRERKDAKTPPRVLHAFSFKKGYDRDAILRIALLPQDRTLRGVLLSQEKEAEFRVDAFGCSPFGVATIVEVPLHDIDPTRKMLLRHSSLEIQRYGIKETRLLTIVASEPGKPGSSPTAFPCGELVIVDDLEPKSSSE